MCWTCGQRWKETGHKEGSEYHYFCPHPEIAAQQEAERRRRLEENRRKQEEEPAMSAADRRVPNNARLGVQPGLVVHPGGGVDITGFVNNLIGAGFGDDDLDQAPVPALNLPAPIFVPADPAVQRDRAPIRHAPAPAQDAGLVQAAPAAMRANEQEEAEFALLMRKTPTPIERLRLLAAREAYVNARAQRNARPVVIQPAPIVQPNRAQVNPVPAPIQANRVRPAHRAPLHNQNFDANRQKMILFAQRWALYAMIGCSALALAWLAKYYKDKYLAKKEEVIIERSRYLGEADAQDEDPKKTAGSKNELEVQSSTEHAAVEQEHPVPSLIDWLKIVN